MKDLDEFTESQLKEELERRHQHRCIGMCDYCGRKAQSKPECKFPKRHNHCMGLNDEVK